MIGIDSGEGGRSARLVGAFWPKAQTGRLECNYRLGRRRPSGFKSNVMRNRSGGRSAAKRTSLEIGMRARMMVQMRGRHLRHPHHPGGTQFKRKRYAACRHKAGRNIGAKQQQGQQQDAGP